MWPPPRAATGWSQSCFRMLKWYIEETNTISALFHLILIPYALFSDFCNLTPIALFYFVAGLPYLTWWERQTMNDFSITKAFPCLTILFLPILPRKGSVGSSYEPWGPSNPLRLRMGSVGATSAQGSIIGSEGGILSFSCEWIRRLSTLYLHGGFEPQVSGSALHKMLIY